MERRRGELNIVLVDDDDVDREAVCRQIRKAAFHARVQELSSARAMLNLGSLADVDCILLDYRLPDSDGLTLLDELVAEDEAGSPPVIILTGEGNERIAVESIKRGAEDYLTKSDLTADRLVRSVRNAMERKQLRAEIAEKTRQLRRMSLYDSLSGLPNRNLYLERLQQAVRGSRRSNDGFALLVMDLVSFKEINDSLGHPAGDRLIRVVSQRLARSCRSSDTVARIGGDEFAAILTEVADLDGAIAAAQKIEALVGEPVPLEEGPVQVGISIGIALFPDHGRTPDGLYRSADAAMYLAKRQSNGYAVYRRETSAPATPSVMLAGHLSEAIELDQLTLHYQPKIEMGSGRPAGVEALVRWDHPQLGLLRPADFIPRIERTAMIEPLTRTVLDKALRQAAAWRAEGLALPIAVNLSARLLDQESLPGMIDNLLAQHAVPASTLTLEVTETGLMTNVAQAAEILSRIKAMGVRVSIDDFGTGYTSLRSLMSLPLSEIKVDKVFVDGVVTRMMENAIVASVVEISRGFDITVVAEGVESEEAWHHLTEIGCHQGQGYLISEPLPVDGLMHWIGRWGRGLAGPSAR